MAYRLFEKRVEQNRPSWKKANITFLNDAIFERFEKNFNLNVFIGPRSLDQSDLWVKL